MRVWLLRVIVLITDLVTDLEVWYHNRFKMNPSLRNSPVDSVLFVGVHTLLAAMEVEALAHLNDGASSDVVYLDDWIPQYLDLGA